ncbi:MAG: cytochrome c peroxidase, partial [Gemmatimonadota bacterium]|nr:cytochrome c peroxidase [Gemmatimonadota bacterium]
MMRLTAAIVAATAATVGLLVAEDRLPHPLDRPEPVEDADYYEDGDPPDARVELGRMLFFDRVLSGNRNISCADCHPPALATSDGLPLGFGEGASGLGPQRRPGATIGTAVTGRVPRNSPALFNLGAREFERLFWDGRVETDPNGYYQAGFVTPARWKLPTGLDNVLAAQAMFPVASLVEMTGHRGENPIADAVWLNNVSGPGGVWEQLGERLREIPEYVEMFRAAFPDRVQSADDVTYVLAANAIATFEAKEFRSDGSPFDRYLRGDEDALDDEARRGMELFYGKAGCASCHAGKFQTDHEFHAIAMPQLGPGKGDGRDPGFWRASGLHAFVEDFGRAHFTMRPEDEFRFRTPSLRNVELTAPYGHSGAFATLEAVVRHHLDPVASLESYDVDQDYFPAIERAVELVGSGSRVTPRWLS